MGTTTIVRDTGSTTVERELNVNCSFARTGSAEVKRGCSLTVIDLTTGSTERTVTSTEFTGAEAEPVNWTVRVPAPEEVREPAAEPVNWTVREADPASVAEPEAEPVNAHDPAADPVAPARLGAEPEAVPV